MTLAHDLMAENAQLEKFAKKARLGTWFIGVCDSARRAAIVGADMGMGEESYVEESYLEDTYEEGDTVMTEING